MTKPNGNKVHKDRISNLHEDVLRQIMSRVPMKHAVRTSTLSRQWKHTYTSIYDVDIDDSHVERILYSDARETSASSFRVFMNKLLTPRVLGIRSFRVVLRGSKHFPGDLSVWIPKILSVGVQNLEIEAFSIRSIDLPGSLTSCGSLTSLRLSLNGSLRFPGKDCFPNVKSLFIQGKHGVIRIYNEQYHHETLKGKLFLLNFRIVEVLELRNCRFMDVDWVEIGAPQLIRCTLDCAFSSRQYNHYTIKIVGPKLVEFNSYRGCLDKFVMCAPKLINAAIENQFSNSEILGCRANAFLNRVSSLEGLKLSSEISKVLVIRWKDGHLHPTFDRLKQLELSWHPKELLELLGVMPCLESLKLNMSYQYQYITEEPLPPFLLPCLKEVELADFRGENTQMELAKMLLGNAGRLERVVVSLGEKPIMIKDEIMCLLQTFVHVSSSSCLIVVS